MAKRRKTGKLQAVRRKLAGMGLGLLALKAVASSAATFAVKKVAERVV